MISKKKILVIIFSFVILNVLFAGCLENLIIFDPVVRRAEPYITKIVIDDPLLKAYTSTIISGCEPDDKECKITKIYRHIVENYEYISDPEGEELIRTPAETIQIKGGDCEDLAILLNSLLENVGIKTYLVLNESHAYSLAYDIDTKLLWPYVEEVLIEQVEKEWGDNIHKMYNNTFTLKAHQSWYYGFDGNTFNETNIDYMTITYSVDSSVPLHFYVVPSSEDFNLLSDNKPFEYYEEYETENKVSFNGTTSPLDRQGGIILRNEKNRDVKVIVDLEFYLHPSFYKLFKDETIKSYKINGTNCVVLDPTAGDYGYPGYDGGIEGEKTAIDPVTKEYYFLE